MNALHRIARLPLLLLSPALVLAALTAGVSAQNQGPPDAPIPGGPGAGSPAGESILAEDGKPALPGRIPDGTPADAVKLWQLYVDMSLGKREERAAIRDFDLNFWVRAKKAGGGASNEFTVNFRFLREEGYVRYELIKSKRMHLRGADGDYLINPGKKKQEERTIKLEGRTFREDRLTLDRSAAIALNFITLADPTNMRLVRLRTSRGFEVTVFPEKLRKRSKGLIWLEVDSPDLQVFWSESGAYKERVFRALIGLEPTSGEPRMALVKPLGGAEFPSSSLLINLTSPTRRGGYLLPGFLEAYGVAERGDLGTSLFASRSRLILQLRDGGMINAGLRAQDFDLASNR